MNFNTPSGPAMHSAPPGPPSTFSIRSSNFEEVNGLYGAPIRMMFEQANAILRSKSPRLQAKLRAGRDGDGADPVEAATGGNDEAAGAVATTSVR